MRGFEIVCEREKGSQAEPPRRPSRGLADVPPPSQVYAVLRSPGSSPAEIWGLAASEPGESEEPDTEAPDELEEPEESDEPGESEEPDQPGELEEPEDTATATLLVL